MAPKSTYLVDNFIGGLSEGSKKGQEGSYRGGIGIDFRTDPDLITSLRKLKLDSSATVDALPLWFKTYGTDLYIGADNGDVYKRNSGGTYSLINAFGSRITGMEIFDDYLFIAQDDNLNRYGPLSGTPAVQTDFLKSSDGEADQLSGATALNTYTLQTSINEGATHKKNFTPAASNIAGVVINVVSKGTGDITVTVHDGSNNVVATKTIVAADAINGVTRFEFTESVPITAAGSYHFHATVSTGTTTIRAATASDHDTAEYATLQYYTTEDVDQSNDLDALVNTSVTTATTISELAVGRQTFTPERSSLAAVSLLVNVNGTGNWTVTVHDSFNATVGTATLSNANVDERKVYAKFSFTTPLKVLPGAQYHFHVTTTVADGSIYSETASDLEGIGFRTHYSVIEDDDHWHPMKFFPNSGKIVIGNSNFLAVYDNIIYREDGAATGSERLQFAYEEKVRALALVGDYLAIGTWKGTSIGDDGDGRLYLWDGISAGINAFKDVPGEVNAMVAGEDGLLYVWVGGRGDIYVYSGSLELVKTLKNIDQNTTIEIYPGAVTMWDGIPRFGISAGSDTTIPRVVHSFGHKSSSYPKALSTDYPISTGTTSNAVSIGALHGLGPAKFYVGWKDVSTYGVDIIDTANDQASTTYETLIFDDERPDQTKRAHSVRITFPVLATGQTITLAYKADRAAAWTTLGTASFASDSTIRFKTFSLDVRFTEIEFKVTLATSTASAPGLISLAMNFETEIDKLDKP
jgi:hypothetical protein